VSGDEAQAVGADDNTYRVYAPKHLSSTTVNGVEVRSCRQAHYVTFPCPLPGAAASDRAAAAHTADGATPASAGSAALAGVAVVPTSSSGSTRSLPWLLGLSTLGAMALARGGFRLMRTHQRLPGRG
jgi:hypothetical protein